MTVPAGPIAHATLVVADAAPLVAAYAALGLVAAPAWVVGDELARRWALPALAGCSVVELATATGAPTLLRLIQVPGAPPRPTRFSHGWMALEILVADVDALVAPALAGGFQIVGAPADLAISASLRAMQVVGPAGEMLYLTQVKAPVPPFELPLSAELPGGRLLGPLFIGVMAVADRGAALAACAALMPAGEARFETKVTVLSRAHGRPLDTRWPLATVALAGRCLFEIDEVHADGIVPAPRIAGVPAGLAWISIHGGAAADGGFVDIAPGVALECLGAAATDRAGSQKL